MLDPTAFSTTLAPTLSAAVGPAVEPDPEEPATMAPEELSSSRWNAFQQRLAGAGLTRREVATMYHEEVSALGVSEEADEPSAEGSPQAATSSAEHHATSVGGCVLLRAPPAHQHLLGVHRCLWQELLDKLGLTHREWSARKSDFYMPRFTNMPMAENVWSEQRLMGPVPVFLGQATRP